MFISKIYFRTSLIANGELEIIFLLNRTDCVLVFNHGDFFLINTGDNFSLVGFSEMANVEASGIEGIMCEEQYDPIYVFLKNNKIIKIGFSPITYGELTQGFQIIDSNNLKGNSIHKERLKKMQIIDLRYNDSSKSKDVE